MVGRAGRRATSTLRVVRAGETGEPDEAPAEAPSVDAMESLLLAQHGYQAAVDAANSAALPSLADFVD